VADTLSKRPRPAAVVADDGTMSNPEGWSMILVADDRVTVVAAWDEDQVFHQWETTEKIVQMLMGALSQMQEVLTELVREP
jgi:hypothetical protein